MDTEMEKQHNAHLLTLAERVIDVVDRCEAVWSNPSHNPMTLDEVISELADTPYQAVLLEALLNNGWNDAVRWALETKKGLN